METVALQLVLLKEAKLVLLNTMEQFSGNLHLLVVEMVELELTEIMVLMLESE